jgi:cytochrome bd-type quinol oxidase subunit 2
MVRGGEKERQAGWIGRNRTLGDRPRPRRDIVHLFLTGLAVVLGLVLLILWISHPIDLPHFGSQGNSLPLTVFLTFIYVTLVIGINSSRRTSGAKSNPWFAAVLLFTAALLLVAIIMLPMLIPLSKQYRGLISLSIAIAGVVAWPFVAQRLKGRSRSVP